MICYIAICGPGSPKQAPGRSKSSNGSQNRSSRLQADRKRHSGRVLGAGEIYGNLRRSSVGYQSGIDLFMPF